MRRLALIFALLCCAAAAQTPGGSGHIQALDFGPPTSQVNCGVTAPTVAASTHYPLKGWVVPSPTNGHFYKATTAGTTASGSQPTFNTGSGSTTTWGSVTFTEQGTTNIKQCQDDVSLYVYGSGQLDGVTLIFNWTDLETSNSGCTAHLAYNFSSLGTTITNILNDSNFPATATVGIIFSGISAGPGPNTHTPCYVFSKTYATSLSTTVMPVGFCSSAGEGATYPGDGAVGTDTVYVATSDTNTDTTGYPWTPSVPYSTAWEAFQDQAIAYIAAQSWANRVSYQRIGVFQGGEVFPHCISLFKTFFAKTTAQIKTTITNYAGALYAHEFSTMGAQTTTYPLMAGNDGTCVPVNSSCVIGYDWADAEATDAEGFWGGGNKGGFGSQGLTQNDTIAFNTFGFADGGTAATSGNYCAGNMCYLFHHFPTTGVHEFQTLAASCPQETTLGDETQCTAGSQQSQTGSLTNILPLMQQVGTTHIELYNQDWLCAFDPNYLPCAAYAASYVSNITAMRQSALAANLTESEPTTDALVTKSQYHRQMTETLTTTDALAHQHNGFLTISQTLTISDALVRQFAAFATLGETLSTSAALVANFIDHTPSLNESLATSDALGKQVIASRSLSETLTTSDTLVRVYAGSRFRLETLTTSDTLTRQFAGLRNPNDSLVTSDAVSVDFIPNFGLTESMTISDAIARQFTHAQALSESLTTSDALARKYAGAKSLAEALSTVDTLTSVSPHTRTLAESLAVVDALVRQFASLGSGALADSVITSDALSVNAKHAQSFTESLTVSDAIARHFTHAQALTETLTTSDTLARTYVGSLALADSVSTSDVLVTVSPHHVSLPEILTTIDSLTRQYTGLRAAGESLSASDFLSAGGLGNVLTLNDSVVTSDAIARQFTGARSFFEILATNDAAAAVTPTGYQIFLVDALVTSDAINRLGSKLPSPPIWLRVTQEAGCSVLVWRVSPSTIAIGQNLYRSQTGGQFLGTLLTPLPATSETYTDCSVIAAQTYFYVVDAFSSSAEGGYSNQVQTTSASGISSPTFLSVLGTSGAATLIWRKSPTVGVTSQIVYRGPVSGGPYTAIQTLDGNAQTFQDLSVTGGQYYYVVTAQVGEQQSPYSNEVTTVIP